MTRKAYGKKFAFFLACTTALATLPSLAYADSAAEAAADQPQDKNADINVIVVTAERVRSDLEKTPVAVSALTAGALETAAIATDSDLQFAVPGLIVRESYNSNNINFSIRGQTIDSLTSSKPAIQTYINAVPSDTNEASPLFDLQSVEVLKGPQGTLFGRNSTGGAVLYNTVEPGNEFGGYVKGRAGDYGLNDFEGALDVPLDPEKALLRVSLYHDKHSGYFTNLYDGSTAGNVDRDAGRATLVLKPMDGLENITVVSQSHSGGNNQDPEIYTVDPPVLNALSGELQYFVPTSNLAKLINSQLQAQAARGPYIVDSDGVNKHRGNNTSLSNTTSYDINADLQLKNIFGYTHSSTFDEFNPLGVDTIGSPLAGFPFSNGQPFTRQADTYSEEVQALGKALDEHLTYVVGLYYLDEQEHIDENNITFEGPILYDADTEDESYAGYVQATYDLSDMVGIKGLGITAGGRETRERVTETPRADSTYQAVDGPLISTIYKPSYQFGLQEQLTNDLLLYAVTRRSFRSGGFNIVAPATPGTAASGGAKFNAETATDYEIGSKYKGHVQDIPIQVNVALYDETVDNVQRSVFAIPPGAQAVSGFTVNVPQAEVSGFELDGQVKPFKWLSLGGSVDYTDARFSKGKNVAQVFGSIDTYGPYPDTPKWTGLLFAETNTSISDDIGVLVVHGDVYGETRYYYSSLANTTNPGTILPGYAIVNFRVALEGISQRDITLAVNIKNAFDKTTYVGGLPTSNTYGFAGALAGAPRTFSFEASYHF